MKTVNKHAIDFIGWYVKETMMRSGNAVSAHSGLISFETVYEKRGGLICFGSADCEEEEFDWRAFGCFKFIYHSCM